MVDRRKIVVEKTALLVGDIMERCVEQLKSAKTCAGVAGIVEDDDIIEPLLYKDEFNRGPMTVEYYREVFLTLREQVMEGSAIAAGVAADGRMLLNGKYFESMNINVFHEDLANEFLSYVVPYSIKKKLFGLRKREIIVLDDDAVLEFTPFTNR